ncbi:MAG: histidine phosphatase family protein [Patescibacteria group bacterium]
MRIYIIRHGQTTSDVENRYGGAYDDHLSEEGVRQAKELAEKISSFGIQKLFSSSLTRAKESAKILNEKLNVEVEATPNIRERNLYGKLSGMVRSEAKEKFPELVEQLRDYRNTIEGAESYEDSKKRMIDAFEKIAASNQEAVAVVTHGGPIKTIFREFLCKEIENVSDCGFAELEVSNGNVELIRTEGIEFKN